MNNNVEKIFNTLQKTTLQQSDRERVRSFLLQYSEHNPVRGQVRVPQQSSVLVWFAHSRIAMATAVIVAVVFAFGGVASASEGALPGDVLYPVKVSIAEPVIGALIVSNEARAKWETELVERRLLETETLAVQGKLDAQTDAELSERFEKHVAIARARMADEETFEATLEVHERVLDALVDDVDEMLEAVGRARIKKIALHKVSAPTAEVVVLESARTEVSLMAVDDTEEKKTTQVSNEETAETMAGDSGVTISKEEAHDVLGDAGKVLQRIENLFEDNESLVAWQVFKEAERHLEEAERYEETEEWGGVYEEAHEALAHALRAEVLLRVPESFTGSYVDFDKDDGEVQGVSVEKGLDVLKDKPVEDFVPFGDKLDNNGRRK